MPDAAAASGAEPAGLADQVQRGMRLAADLPEVMPDDAGPRLKPVYQDIQQTLRVPFVNLIFRSLANFPDYFVPAWQQLGPVLGTHAAEAAADRLRAAALLAPAPALPPGTLDGVDDARRLRAFNDTIHYVLPKLLLTAVSLDRATFGRPEPRPGAAGEPLPRGVAEGTTKVQMVKPAEATGTVAAVFQSVKERHGHPLVSSYYRALGNWPGVLEAAWQQIAPRVGSAAYQHRRAELVRMAEDAADTLPLAPLSADTLGAEEREQVRALLAAFRLKFIPEMLLDVVWIKAMLDGADAAPFSPFSIAREGRAATAAGEV